MILKGKNLVKESLLSNTFKIYKAVVKESFSDDSILKLLKDKNIKTEIINDKLFKDKYFDSQGIILESSEYKYYSIDDVVKNVSDSSLVLILDSLEDPQNFGNIIRTFDAFNYDYIIIPKNRSIEVNDTVCKVSVGAINHVKIAQVVNINNAIERLKENGYFVFGTDMNQDQMYDEIRVDMPIAVVIGNEGSGMSKLTRKMCDSIISIPMKGTINSLNASISAAIIISSIDSRRRKL